MTIHKIESFLKLLLIILPFEKSRNLICQIIFLVVWFLKMPSNKFLLLKKSYQELIPETVLYLWTLWILLLI